ncbi:MFS transporter [Acetobacter cibinongensis]|uniref:MFS transporter n=1 Tax=Acetobacter cibinongensis TaxID=146475 RepID=A0A0D6N603_9PROT|nr:MFS transporter [Acetobacter cibinongensis]GAN61452.1 major facilitator superfamily glucarate/galactonate transporter [Acetobacter cibinongensis]GBQ14407.1 D-galactonate transporter [Acetobacter cibinongensis NRIC 0482]GEL60020.1 MFS transporter [Acetobacter cibinongensis]
MTRTREPTGSTVTHGTGTSDTVRVGQRSAVRYSVLAFLFTITAINYGDRATLGIAGTSISQDLGLTPISMGYIFSAFGWAYVLNQVPGGWLLDRFGSIRVYGVSLFAWSACTLAIAGISHVPHAFVFPTLFLLWAALGLVEAPTFPANSRIVSSWFPTSERGLATSIFNSAQYVAVAFFAPLMGWITQTYGWKYIFSLMGALGMVLAIVWLTKMQPPARHPGVNAAELAYLREGGALVDIDDRALQVKQPLTRKQLRFMLSNRTLLGVYGGQYCITALLYFFLTWFPLYLHQSRGFSLTATGFAASIPALCGLVGAIFGGALSDKLLRAGRSENVARKTPYVLGMAAASSICLCNFIQSGWLIVAVMSFAFFGKGVAAIGWAVISDIAPKETPGLAAGIFNGIGNIAGIVTPIVIGYIVALTKSYDGAIIFVAAHCVVAIALYLFVVGKIRRLSLPT